MLPLLESLARTIEQEILITGTIALPGFPPVRRNALRASSSPYQGLCHIAVAKLQDNLRQQAPDLRMRVLSFEYAERNGNVPAGKSAWERGRHVIAEVIAPEGTYLVDPTIRQFLPEAKSVYGPGEIYPLQMVQRSIIRR